MTTKQAVVLVGGKGTRLGSLTTTTPKPLMSLDGDRVLLDEILFNIARHGFNDILLLAGHMHEQITLRYAGKTLWDASLTVVVEPLPAGTAGALANAAPKLAESFLLVNGDTVFDINLTRLEQILFADPTASGVLALRRVSDTGRYGTVDLQAGRVRGFYEKNNSQADGLVSGGIGLFRRSILSFIDRVPSSIEVDIYPRLAACGELLGMEFTGYFIDIGLPEALKKARQEIPLWRERSAVFFDRDGVLNHDEGYTHRVSDLRWVNGAMKTIRRVNDMGALVIVITNQAGVAHGFYTETDVALFHAAMNDELARHGAHIDAFYLCPFHPQAKVSAYLHPDHPDRKPNPGMFISALAQWPINRLQSVMIGDRDDDLEAARRAGISAALFAGGDLYAFTDPFLSKLEAVRAAVKVPQA